MRGKKKPDLCMNNYQENQKSTMNKSCHRQNFTNILQVFYVITLIKRTKKCSLLFTEKQLCLTLIFESCIARTSHKMEINRTHSNTQKYD